MSRTTHPRACVAVRNWAVIKALDSATKAWLPMDMVSIYLLAAAARGRGGALEARSVVGSFLTAGGGSLSYF